ncbi:MAG: hypothetical protein Q8882_03590 [Bacillota bacterium]|nr:hypothetical protein [Bacillota bacterium]
MHYRYISFICALFLVVNTILPMQIFAEGENSVTYLYSYNNGTSLLKNKKGSIKSCSEKDHPNAVKVGAASGGEIFAWSNYTATDKSVCISFDLNYTKFTDSKFYICPDYAVNPDGGILFGYTKANGKLYWNNNCEPGYENPIFKYSYYPGRWYHADIWLDFPNHNVYCYINGKLIWETKTENYINSFSAFSFSAAGSVLLDNLNIIDYKNYSATLPESIKGHPDYLACKVASAFNIGFGNMIMSKEAKIPINVTENSGTDKVLNVKIDVTSEEDPSFSYSETKQLRLNALSSSQIAFNFKAPLFGYYNAKLEIKDTESLETYYNSARFSVINAPEKGNPKVGLNSHIGLRTSASSGPSDYKTIEAKFENEAKAGFTMHRISLPWAHFEASPGVYSLQDELSHALEVDQTYGFETMAILSAVQWVYTDYNHNDYIISDGEERGLDLFYNYCKNLAKATKGKARLYEMLNEVDGSWDAEKNICTPKQYTEMMKRAYKAIKEENSSAVFCAFSITNSTKGYDFIKECLDNGAKGYFDAVTIHPYSARFSPEAKLKNDILKIRNLLDSYGLQNVKIYLSELGYTSCFTGEELQAAFAVRASAVINDLVDKCYWYVDQEKPFQANGEEEFGFLRRWILTDTPNEAKPVYLALANWNTLMTGAVTIGSKSFEAVNSEAYMFTLPNGKSADLLWARSYDEISVNVNLGAISASLYDIYGNKTELKSTSGIYNLKLSHTPIYVIGDLTSCDIK